MRPTHVVLLMSMLQASLIGAANNTVIDFSTAWQKCSFYSNTDRWMICPSEIICPLFAANSSEIIELFMAYGCMYCPEDGKGCQGAIDDLRPLINDVSAESQDVIDSLLTLTHTTCARTCEAAIEGETCSQNKTCTPGQSFCDYSLGESGSCQACPVDVDECYQQGYLGTERARKECVKCSLDCASSPVSEFTVDGQNISSKSIESIITNTTELFGSGTLIDCSDLILHSVKICPGATGKVCLIHDYTLDTLYWQLTDKAERSGCTAVVIFGDYLQYPNHEPCDAQHSYDHLGIPFVCISHNDGEALLNTINRESLSEVYTGYLWLECPVENAYETCSNVIPCSNGSEFCNFHKKVEDGVYVEGWCVPCAKDPLHCYFDPRGGAPRTPEFIKSCVKTCKADVYFDRCKFCPAALTGSNLAERHREVAEEGESQCHFCPDDNIPYPNRKFPMFGTEIECWQMQAFFERIKYAEDSLNCRLAQSFNHVCGCEGTGYAGADTDAKKATLVWLPRMMALLSIAGSSFIIYDATRIHTRRSKLLYQLLITISIFDIIGSIAYAFTSLPTPVEDYIYGGKGNQATCTAQGFFIQIGTTACFINSSLSSYYYLSIIRGISEDALKKKRLLFFIPPILTGLIFAFVGIPWYYDMLLWCNNTANYWPEIPVIISIAWATVVMGAVCIGVIKTERKTRRYSTNANTNHSISTMVVKQSFLFVGAFYVTWVPYLALQHVWASGRAFTSYGFVLYASSSVPLQGFLNCIVYIKPRYLRRGSAMTSTSTTSKWCKFSWFCRKKAPPAIAVDKLDDKGCQSELQSTSKLKNPPDNNEHDLHKGGSAIHQSIMNSSMLGERVSFQQNLNDDQLAEIVDTDDKKDEIQSSALEQSVLKSSMLGESL